MRLTRQGRLRPWLGLDEPAARGRGAGTSLPGVMRMPGTATDGARTKIDTSAAGKSIATLEAGRDDRAGRGRHPPPFNNEIYTSLRR